MQAVRLAKLFQWASCYNRQIARVGAVTGKSEAGVRTWCVNSAALASAVPL